MLESLSVLADAPAWQIALAATWLLLQGAVLPSVPEEIVVVTMGVLWSQGRIGFGTALVAVLAGLLPANAIAVLVGGRLERGLARFPPFRRALRSRSVSDARGAVRRHGLALVVATRFTPLVRGPVYLACGASGMGLRRFALADGGAAIVQVPLLLLLGARTGAGAGSVAEALGRAALLGAGLLVAAAVAVVAARRLRRTAVPARGT